MKTTSIRLRKSFTAGPTAGLLAGALLVSGSSLAAYGTDAFTVDPGRSYISISGNVAGAPLDSQGSGSLTAYYTGTVLANLGSGTIQFPGQSGVTARAGGSWQPLADGSSGSAPADYGVAATSYAYWTSGVAAARDVELDVTSGSLALVNGQFDTRGITVSIPTGAASSVAYQMQGAINASGADSLAGGSVTGEVAQGSLVTVGAQQVLTIPIHYTINYSLLSSNDTTLTVTGQLAATRNL
jgi:hypothetical protein